MLFVSKDFLDEKSKVIVSFLENKLDKQEIRLFIENCMAGEEGVAYELLCAQIYGEQIKLSKKVFLLIKEMCLSWRLDFSYWLDLESLVIGDFKKYSEVFGKVVFPKTWDEEKIKNAVLNIATDSNLEKIPLITNGELLTKDGNPARFAVKGIRDGITIRVILESEGNGIIDYYPLYGQGVSCLYLDVEDYNVD